MTAPTGVTRSEQARGALEGPCGDCEIIGACKSDHPCAVRLQAEIERLHKALGEQTDMARRGRNRATTLERRVAKARAERDALLAVARWVVDDAEHHGWCTVNHCECGLTDALASLPAGLLDGDTDG